MKYHWIDDSVKIDFAVPKEIQGLIDDAEAEDLAENYGYLATIEAIDVWAKNACAEGLQTEKQWETLVLRYRA